MSDKKIKLTGSPKKFKRVLALAVFIVCMALLVICEIADFAFTDESRLNDIIYTVVTRFLGSVICILLLWYSSFLYLIKPSGKGSFLRNVLLTLPCWLVVINNFPIIAYFSGTATITSPFYYVITYALACFFTGLFEETAFRGCIFMLILNKKEPSRRWNFWSVVISSAAFGLVHFINLLSGSGIVPVLMQVGYSFLIGGMCAIILLRTGNLWYSVLLHAVFNFCGGVIPNLGNGEIWDIPTIAITAVLATAVTIYMVFVLYKTPPKTPLTQNENFL